MAKHLIVIWGKFDVTVFLALQKQRQKFEKSEFFMGKCKNLFNNEQKNTFATN